MIIEAICVVAGAVPGVAWAWWERREAGALLAVRAKEIEHLQDKLEDARDCADNADAKRAFMRKGVDMTVARNRALATENADLRAKLEALQPKPKTPPKRGANGRFVAREVAA